MTPRRQLEPAIGAPTDAAASGKTRAPVAAIAELELPRRCAHCQRRMKKTKRPDALTCGKRCRQAKSRAHRAELAAVEHATSGVPQASRLTLSARHISQRVMTRAALSRAGCSLDDEGLRATRLLEEVCID